MTEISDDEIGAIIYTELLGYSKPCSVSEMCDKIAGLKKRQDQVAAMLLIMCDSDMVVNVGGKYILKENWTPEQGRNTSPLACDGPAHCTTLACDGPAHCTTLTCDGPAHYTTLTCDGPAHGTTCSNRHSDGVGHEDRLPTVHGATGEYSVVAPQTSSLAPQPSRVVPQASRVAPQASRVAPQASRVAPQSSNLAQHTSRSVPQASREMVRQSVVRRSSSSDSTCDNSALEQNRDVLSKIIDLLQQSSHPLKAKDIAQRIGIGQARSSVNRYLYFLEGQNILKKNGQTEWNLVKEVKGEDVHVYAAQLAKKPTAKSKGKQSAGSAASDCPCPNAGRQCMHVTNNFQQNIYNNYYNMQFGENNQMVSTPPPDEAPNGGGN